MGRVGTQWAIAHPALGSYLVLTPLMGHGLFFNYSNETLAAMTLMPCYWPWPESLAFSLNLG